MISDEAVEAAARANYEVRTGKQWSVASNGWQALERSWMRHALEAAAPHMLLEAWRDGWESGWDDARQDWGKTPNPYGSQP